MPVKFNLHQWRFSFPSSFSQLSLFYTKSNFPTKGCISAPKISACFPQLREGTCQYFDLSLPANLT